MSLAHQKCPRVAAMGRAALLPYQEFSGRASKNVKAGIALVIQWAICGCPFEDAFCCFWGVWGAPSAQFWVFLRRRRIFLKMGNQKPPMNHKGMQGPWSGP